MNPLRFCAETRAQTSRAGSCGLTDSAALTWGRGSLAPVSARASRDARRCSGSPLQMQRRTWEAMLLRRGQRFERVAIGDADNAFFHPDNADAPPFLQALVDVLARRPHQIGELMPALAESCGHRPSASRRVLRQSRA